MQLAKDTPTEPDADKMPVDPHKTAQGGPDAPGGKDAPATNASDMSHGQEGYPGPRAGGETDKPGGEADGNA